VNQPVKRKPLRVTAEDIARYLDRLSPFPF
jgi:hypothetical protein